MNILVFGRNGLRMDLIKMEYGEYCGNGQMGACEFAGMAEVRENQYEIAGDFS